MNTHLARRLGRLGISCRRAAISWSCTGDYGITHGSTGINRTRGAPLSAHTAICKRSLIYAITFNPSASDLESSEHDMCVSNETYFSARPHAQRWLSPVWRRARPFAREVRPVCSAPRCVCGRVLTCRPRVRVLNSVARATREYMTYSDAPGPSPGPGCRT